MAEIQRQRIKSMYADIMGTLTQLPLEKDNRVVGKQIIDHHNGSVDELSQASGSDYSRYKISHVDTTGGYYLTSVVRTRMGSVVRRLEEEYGFGQSGQSSSAPVIVTVQQNQQVNVTVTPIQQLISDTDDSDLKVKLQELKEAVEVQKSPSAASRILTEIKDKSWELFIKVLPYILENMGKSASQ